MFCNKCGEEIKEGAAFCPKCGEKISVVTADTNDNITYVEANSKRNSTIGKAVVGFAVLVVAVIILGTVFGGRSYKKVVKTATESVFSLTEKSINDLLTLFPDEMIEKTIEEEDVEDKNELVEKMADKLESQRELYEEQLEDFSYEIGEEEDFSEGELQDLTESFEDMGVTLRKEIKEAKHVTLNITIVTKNNGEQSEELTFDVFKLGRNWYLAETDIF